MENKVLHWYARIYRHHYFVLAIWSPGRVCICVWCDVGEQKTIFGIWRQLFKDKRLADRISSWYEYRVIKTMVHWADVQSVSIWWQTFKLRNSFGGLIIYSKMTLSGLFSGVWAESLMKQVVVAHSARGSDADASCTCTCSLPAECCAAADCSAAAVFAVTGMINNCCCCCCTDDNSPSAVSTDRTLHTHSCTLAPDSSISARCCS